MKKTLLIFWILMLTIQCVQKREMHITQISSVLPEDAVLIDVRTPEEYQAGHLPDAVNINWFDSHFQQEIRDLGTDKVLYLYCKKGGRSAQAAKLLDSLGYEVVDLIGGYDAYVNRQKP